MRRNRKEQTREYYLRDRIKIMARQKRYYEEHPDKKMEQIEYRNNRLESLRISVLMYYGGKCACCGFDDFELKLFNGRFLQIDHIYGRGRMHKKTISSEIVHWLIKNNLPSGFRVLCAGCNVSMLPGADKCILHKWSACEAAKILESS